ncbi:MAG: hypothetical protein AAGA16_19030, partial [Cyanobacteria bacterium P01_E01_bin.35]
MTNIPGGFWFKDHCLKITPKINSGGVRYRYPGEDWTLVAGDDFSLDDNVAGQCEGSYYSVSGTLPLYLLSTGEYLRDIPISV